MIVPKLSSQKPLTSEEQAGAVTKRPVRETGLALRVSCLEVSENFT